MGRRTVIFEQETERKLRELQAKLMVKRDQTVAFNDVTNELLLLAFQTHLDQQLVDTAR